jgi:hypothetical protein
MIIRLCLTVLTIIAIIAIGGTAAAQSRGTSPTARRPAGKPAPPVTDVKLDALKPRSTTLPASTRNPFRFSEAPIKAVANRDGLHRGPVVAPPPPVPAGPVGPPPPPPLPPIQLRFIGLIEAPDKAGRVALLSDGKGGLMNGREGDLIEGRYRVLRVGADSLDLAYADGRGRQTIRLSGQ